jgi:hypothetical protein
VKRVIGTRSIMSILEIRSICAALSSASQLMKLGKRKKSGAKESIPRVVQTAAKSICGSTRTCHATEKNIFHVVSIRSRTLRDSKSFIKKVFTFNACIIYLFRFGAIYFFIFLSMPPVDITSVDMSAEQMAM